MFNFINIFMLFSTCFSDILQLPGVFPNHFHFLCKALTKTRCESHKCVGYLLCIRNMLMACIENTTHMVWTFLNVLLYALSCREEADELCRTLEENEDQSRTASEMADVLYHAMVLLSVKGVKIEDVLQVLRVRFAQSGVEEKSSRKA